ncbi:cyclin-P3-1-like [Durio zibethinus]|uniref:Cyclin n=1 Tax=Durio zibethinus TaxID=66656 RepID=A0A6P5WVS8_DURZI|nr:cyclin-P3-1-like [Durio zibethinus]
MATSMGKGKAVESDPYIALGLDESGNWVPGAPRVLSLLSSVLERSIQRNEKLLQGSKRKDVVTIFHGSKPPALSIGQYIERIFKYCKCSNSCFVVAIIYIDRFLQRMDAYLTSLNVHRLLITSVMVAAKFMDDQCYNNAYYAKVGGVSTEEMNGLEMKFLFSLDFRLHVTTEVFNKYCLKMEREGDVGYQTDQKIHGYRPNKDDRKLPVMEAETTTQQNNKHCNKMMKNL